MWKKYFQVLNILYILNEMIVTSLQSHSIYSRSIDVFKYVFFQIISSGLLLHICSGNKSGLTNLLRCIYILQHVFRYVCSDHLSSFYVSVSLLNKARLFKEKVRVTKLDEIFHML